MFPVSAADRRAYASMGVGYWLAVTSVAGACVAGLIGFANLWVRIAGSSFLGGYISWLGLDASGFADQTLDPHSHLMALAIMGGIVAVAAVTFSVLRNDSKARVLLARLGLWVAVVGMVATTLVMAAVAFLGFAPPTLFTSGQDGANGMAGDDVVMSVIGLGAMVVVVALLADRRFWKDGLRLLVLGTWIAAMLLNVLGGFYIELNEDKFQAGMSANDAAFSTAQPMTGIFLLTVMSALLLLVDHYRIGGVYRRLITAVTAVGLLAALVGSTLWTFADPSNNGLSFGIYITGTALAYAAILLGALAIRVARTARLTLPAT
jgi:hypothetical protein